MLLDADLAQGMLRGGGEDGHRQHQRAPGRADGKFPVDFADQGLHHLAPTQRMHVEDLDPEATGFESGLGHRVGNVVVFQIEEDLAPFGADHPHHLGTAARKELLADLEHPDLAMQPAHPLFGVVDVIDVESEDQPLAGRLTIAFHRFTSLPWQAASRSRPGRP